MSLPVPRRTVSPRLRKKLEAALQASLGNVSTHTEQSYRRGLVVFALWLQDEGELPELQPAPPPRGDERGAWELRALDVAGAYLCSLAERDANLLAETFLRDLLYGASPVTRSTAESRLAALRWAVREAKRLGQVDWLLSTKVPRARKDTGGRLVEKAGRDMRGPTPPEADALLEAAARSADPRALPIMSLLRYEGLREHEIRQLDVGDLDAKGETLLVVRKKRTEAAPCLLSSKSLDAILRWLGQHPVQRPTSVGPGPLFTGGHHGSSRGRVSKSTLFRIVRRCCADAGIEAMSPHRIRHRACTDLVRSGIRMGLPEEELLSLTGHSSRSALYPYYEAAKDRKLARATLNSIDDLYRSQETFLPPDPEPAKG